MYTKMWIKNVNSGEQGIRKQGTSVLDLEEKVCIGKALPTSQRSNINQELQGT
jgi:hypothetical protein